MSHADQDLIDAVQLGMAESVRAHGGVLDGEVLARAAIAAVRRHDAAKVIPFRRPGPVLVRTPGWDGDVIAARHAPEGPR